MDSKYEKLYKSERHLLGQPTQEYVDFFNNVSAKNLSVLDVGCGQGRDALFIARLGHSVFGIDISPTGIEQLLEDAIKEDLDINAEVIDVVEYIPTMSFDIVVIDRTLHMLEEDKRLTVLKNIESSVNRAGYVLIADEKKNLQAMRSFFIDSKFSWQVIKDIKGFLFLQKAG